MVQIKRWCPCPMAGRQNAYKQRFWCHDRLRSEKDGRFGYARGVFHEETTSRYFTVTQLYIIVLLVKRSRKYTLGSHDYANTAELVFIIGASLICPRPCPEAGSLWGDPVRTEDRTSGRADNFIWRPRHVLHA